MTTLFYKADYSMWIAKLPSGLEIHLRDIKPEDEAFLRKAFCGSPDEPKKKTIKLEAWLDNTGWLKHFAESEIPVNPTWTRLPQLDITTEVEE